MADLAPGVSLGETPGGTRLIVGAATSIAAFVAHIDAVAPRRLRTWRDFGEGEGASGSGAVSPFLAAAVYGWFENGGGECWIAGAGQGGPLAGYQAALEELNSMVTIVVTPDLWEGEDDGAVVAKAVARHCADTRRMALLHTLKEAEPAEVPGLLGLDEEEAQFTTVYYPWLNVRGVDEGEWVERAVPPAGHIAGIWARIDAERGVHRAPANTAVHGARSLQRNLTDGEQAQISEARVNCLRSFLSEGLLVWGARTLASEEEDWTYLNVRRLANYLYASIADGTRWSAFESNGEKLQATVRADVTAFLTAQWRTGALVGKTPQESFYVVCDETNNPGDGTAAGTLVIDVGFAAVRPAEFIRIQITQQVTEQQTRLRTPEYPEGYPRHG
ncbi:phage tail sheath C-terminal domain-containing protein [Streptomyces sp. NPDC006288]|uniref:phage tail sheath family protein n=1 Tax=Streptomyces sp. NPDC006288 TaxID=3156743 RepID=UPI0033B2AEC2